MRALVPLACFAANTFAVLGCDVGLDGKRFDGGVGGGSSAATTTAGAGGAGGAGVTTATTGTGGSGGGVACLVSDELDDPRTLTECWTNAADAEGGADDFAALAIDETGYLVTRPAQWAGFWDDQRGPYLYQVIAGDFAVVTYITAHRVDDENQPPTVDYNLGGLVVRTPPPTTENWLKYELGYVDAVAGLGTLAGSTLQSTSMHLLPYHSEGLFRGRLALCRAGQTVHYFFHPGAEGSWSTDDLQYSAGAGTAAPTFPRAVQVGITVSGYSAETPDVEAAFDYVRFSVQPMADAAACAAVLTTLSP